MVHGQNNITVGLQPTILRRPNLFFPIAPPQNIHLGYWDLGLA